jgi:hypothetical protein
VGSRCVVAHNVLHLLLIFIPLFLFLPHLHLPPELTPTHLIANAVCEAFVVKAHAFIGDLSPCR